MVVDDFGFDFDSAVVVVVAVVAVVAVVVLVAEDCGGGTGAGAGAIVVPNVDLIDVGDGESDICAGSMLDGAIYVFVSEAVVAAPVDVESDLVASDVKFVVGEGE